MKRLMTIFAISLLAMSGCDGNKQPVDELITVDVTASYPKKELVLQDFMDVEYIPLETTDEFVNRGIVKDIGKETILAINRDNGDIFVYGRTGKALRKINRKGQGDEEYNSCFGIILDEDKGEMFINDIHLQKILVYDLYGNFRRSFKHRNGSNNSFYTDMFNYDKENLICYDAYNKTIPFIIISKQDGSIIKDIITPFKEKLLLQQKTMIGDTPYTVSPGPYRAIIPFKGNWILSELSSDTIYTLSPDYSLRPFLVRTPPIQSMDPKVFLLLRFFSDRYIFMEAIKNIFSPKTHEEFPRAFFMYDKQEKTFGGYTIYNGDFTSKKEIYMNLLRPVNHEIESWQVLEADDLVQSYERGKLKGKLKEVAATLNEDSNPVIMLIKHKK